MRFSAKSPLIRRRAAPSQKNMHILTQQPSSLTLSLTFVLIVVCVGVCFLMANLQVQRGGKQPTGRRDPLSACAVRSVQLS